LGQARALASGQEPLAPQRAQAYRVRGGGAHTPASQSLEQVMSDRFGSTTGLVV
jgi:hypothetical protein